MRRKGTALAILVLLAMMSLPVQHRASGTSTVSTDVEVANERHVIPGYNEPNTPPNVAVSDQLRAAITDPAAFRDGQLNLNQAIYIRFFDKNRTTEPENIIILVPGAVSGANSFRPTATQVVTMSGGSSEVWAVDRRSNLLEDLAPMVKAESAGTEESAVEAMKYFSDQPAGRGGYIASNPFGEVSRFMSEWGLDVHVRDLKAIVDEARTVEGANVFLGGHSLGAMMAEAFAAYDFEGVAGYRLISGLILLDGTGVPGIAALMNDEQYVTSVNGLRNPQGAGNEPFVASPIGPYQFQLLEISAMLALINPEGPSPLEQVAPELVSVPMTNAAALGVNIDDEFQQQPVARFSIGFLQVGDGQTVSSIASKTTDPAGMNPNGIYTAKPLGTGTGAKPNLQAWAIVKNLKTISSSFNIGPEPSDLQTVARMFLTGRGQGELTTDDANFAEWYFPQRLVFDTLRLSGLDSSRLTASVVAAMTARGGNRPALTENKRVDVPVLAVYAKNGIFPPSYGTLPFSFYKGSINTKDFTLATMTNYAHGDVLTGVDKGSLGKDVPEMIFAFVNGTL
jgi:pimeloyl-ACP methyl ester carboxylesterase